MEIIAHQNFVPTVVTTVLVFFLSYWSFRFINAFLQDNSLAIKALLFLFAVVIVLFSVFYWSPLFYAPLVALALSLTLTEIAKANWKRHCKRVEERRVLEQTRTMLLQSDKHKIELDITEFDRKVVEKFMNDGSSEVWLHYYSRYHHNSGDTTLIISR